jgi:hypothetical protein
MRTSKAEAEQLIAQMMAATCPLGKYSMSYDLAKSCAKKSVENSVRDIQHLMEVYPNYKPIFIGQLEWYQSVLLNLQLHVYQQ